MATVLFTERKFERRQKPAAKSNLKRERTEESRRALVYLNVVEAQMIDWTSSKRKSNRPFALCNFQEKRHKGFGVALARRREKATIRFAFEKASASPDARLSSRALVERHKVSLWQHTEPRRDVTDSWRDWTAQSRKHVLFELDYTGELNSIIQVSWTRLYRWVELDYTGELNAVIQVSEVAFCGRSTVSINNKYSYCYSYKQ